MNIKQLLLISAICTFSAQAMQEQKESKEIQEYRINREFQEISQSCPSSVNFLLKVLVKKRFT